MKPNSYRYLAHFFLALVVTLTGCTDSDYSTENQCEEANMRDGIFTSFEGAGASLSSYDYSVDGEKAYIQRSVTIKNVCGSSVMLFDFHCILDASGQVSAVFYINGKLVKLNRKIINSRGHNWYVNYGTITWDVNTAGGEPTDVILTMKQWFATKGSREADFAYSVTNMKSYTVKYDYAEIIK